ncbi:MAG: M23 family metallopeptidase [Patescibacteria group bacterium]
MKILSPLENSARFYLNWIQVRPKITQKFGAEFKKNGHDFYHSLGLRGHNGLDFSAKIGTPIFAPLGGTVKIGDDGAKGYGKFVKIRSATHKMEIIVAHLSEIAVENNSEVAAGDRLGATGNSGASTGPHLHLGLRFLLEKNEPVFGWTVQNYENGFLGYVDPLEFLVTWKGDFTRCSLAD